MTPAEYEHMRASPRRFAYAVGHEEGIPESLAIERNDGYVIVEKDGEAGDLVEESDLVPEGAFSARPSADLTRQHPFRGSRRG